MNNRLSFCLQSIPLLLLCACRSGQNTSSQEREQPGNAIVFADTIHHFGKISMEAPIDSFDFKFKNTGERMAVVLSAKTSCHCTKVKYSPRPIKPGEESYIRVIFDGTGRPPEYFNKSVLVYTSASDEYFKLTIDGHLE